MIYKVTPDHLYFYFSWGKQKAFIGDNAAVYADVSIFHQYLMVGKKLGFCCCCCFLEEINEQLSEILLVHEDEN